MESGGETRRMVIVGGGIAGSLLAKSLQFNAALTLVDPIVTSVATDITDTEVLTADGHRISYDYLVIATGHRDLVPTTKTERLHQYKEATDFPDKKVTLVHKGPRLLEFIGPKASDKTLRWLKSRKVEVKLEQAVDLNSTTSEGSQSVYKTSIGEIIKADCHFLCAGKTLASTWLNETILKTNLNGNGSLMVDEHLRVNGRSNIFAIGDITDVPELKRGFLAQKHAMVVAKNLKALMRGGKDRKMAKYEGGSDIALVSLGRKDAVAQFPFATISGCLPGLLKSKDLFVGKTRKNMGLQP
ncbi:hypothetical protein V6N12_011925 [Hibiscus sabdariffa]|uniref:FAD/NAD(P)-binding domain-containing protein n=1 Tax=Hibiscus sabdariffa TaxID=183260 RepID=A0ABR2CGP4_9ROSI